MSNSKVLSAISIVTVAAIAVMVLAFFVTPKSTPISTQSSSGPIKITQTRVTQPSNIPAPPKAQDEGPCPHPRNKSIGYLVTRVVEKHWAGTDVDVISITKAPPAHASQAYGVFIAYPMSPGDMYFRDYKSCDAGKTWTADDKMRILPKSLIHQTRLAP